MNDLSFEDVAHKLLEQLNELRCTCVFYSEA